MNFTEKHKATGTICNASQRDTYSNDRAHASTVVCDREECRAKANAWIGAMTNEQGVYRSFVESRARAAAPVIEVPIVDFSGDVPLFDLPGGPR